MFSNPESKVRKVVGLGELHGFLLTYISSNLGFRQLYKLGKLAPTTNIFQGAFEKSH